MFINSKSCKCLNEIAIVTSEVNSKFNLIGNDIRCRATIQVLEMQGYRLHSFRVSVFGAAAVSKVFDKSHSF